MMSTASEIVEIHPPHRESWDIDAGINYQRNGTPRRLTDRRLTEFGLYAARPLIDHPRLARMASWLLPSVGLRITDFSRHPGVQPDFGVFEDYYIDIVEISVEGSIWRTTDYYLDLFVWTGERVEIVDIDEFVAAVAVGHLEPETAEWALSTSHRALEGITAHNYDVNAWLRASYDIELTWPGF